MQNQWFGPHNPVAAQASWSVAAEFVHNYPGGEFFSSYGFPVIAVDLSNANET
jgi:hypothetical protein